MQKNNKITHIQKNNKIITMADSDDESTAWWNSLTYEEKVNHLDEMGMLLRVDNFGPIFHQLVPLTGEEREAKIVELGIIRESDNPLEEENATQEKKSNY